MLNRMHIVIEDGKKISMPRYYKSKIYTDADREMISQHQASAVLIREQESRMKYAGDYDRDLNEWKLSEFRKLKLKTKGHDKI